MAKKNKSLAEIGIVWKAVPIEQEDGSKVTLYVRGLSPADLAAIMADDGGDDLAAAYRTLSTGAVTPEALEGVLLGLIKAMPELLAKLIARAADLPDEWKAVLSFSIGAQIELVQAIAERTFSSESARKKAMEIISQFVVPSGLEKPTASQQPSAIGSGD